ncbi:calcium homeostasis modulator protein 5-like isoform X2 [Carcharodon carcharias]|nr:calcium homeostasis modulator protein 5-like isoform X2 [Carcharodon carcharias]
MPLDLEIFNQLKELLQNNTSTTFKVIGNAMLFLFLYGLEELLEKDIACPCTSSLANITYTVLFFVFPSVLLFLIRLMLQFVSYQWHRLCNNCAARRPIQRKSLMQIANSKPRCKECYFLRVWMLFRLCVPSVIWMAVLFLDGDYYACAWQESENYTVCAEFNCNKISIRLRSDTHLCHDSRLIGAVTLFIFLIVLITFNCLHHCGQEKYCKIYEDLYAEHEQKMIMSKLKEEAAKQAEEGFEEKWNSKHIFSHLKTKQNTSGAEMSNV